VLSHVALAQVAPDQQHDATVVRRQLGDGPIRVAVLDCLEEVLMVRGRVLDRRPAQGARDLLPQTDDEASRRGRPATAKSRR